MKTIEFKKLDENATLPTRAHEDDAGLDLYTLEQCGIGPYETKIIKTGIAGAIPTGYVGLIKDRSSLAIKGMRVGAGVIDAQYRGEIGIVMQNLSRGPKTFESKTKIAQLLIIPVALPAPIEVKELSNTDRGIGGYGSTGD